MSRSSLSNATAQPRLYRVAQIGYFQDECYVFAHSEEEAEDQACMSEDWETVYKENDFTEAELIDCDRERAAALSN